MLVYDYYNWLIFGWKEEIKKIDHCQADWQWYLDSIHYAWGEGARFNSIQLSVEGFRDKYLKAQVV